MTIIEQYIQTNNFGKNLGMEFKIVEPGLVHYLLTIQNEHLATPISAHGGVISALMDGLLGVTALSVTESENKVVSTVEFKINFLAPALLGDQLLGIGKIEHKGNRLIITSGEICCVNKNNILIAKALGTFNSYPAEKAGYLSFHSNSLVK
jgi:uncharacterized protein (TIGR00369 family)